MQESRNFKLIHLNLKSFCIFFNYNLTKSKHGFSLSVLGEVSLIISTWILNFMYWINFNIAHAGFHHKSFLMSILRQISCQPSTNHSLKPQISKQSINTSNIQHPRKFKIGTNFCKHIDDVCNANWTQHSPVPLRKYLS